MRVPTESKTSTEPRKAKGNSEKENAVGGGRENMKNSDGTDVGVAICFALIVVIIVITISITIGQCVGVR